MSFNASFPLLVPMLSAVYANNTYTTKNLIAEPKYHPYNLPLDSAYSWATPGNSLNGDWVQVDFPYKMRAYSIITQGQGDADSYISKYRLEVKYESYSGYVPYGDEFKGNSDRSTKVRHDFDKPIDILGFRIIPITFKTWPAMRADMMVLPQAQIVEYERLINFLSNVQTTTVSQTQQEPGVIEQSWQMAKDYKYIMLLWFYLITFSTIGILWISQHKRMNKKIARLSFRAPVDVK